jgi:hypothetical protein
MARKITPDFTFDEMENEIRYTRASLLADPDASDLAPSTDGWLGGVTHARDKDGLARTAVTEASAHRYVANTRLDRHCRNFGRDLAHTLENDRSSARWHRFFPGTVDDFISQPLEDQANACIAWLPLEEPALAPHLASIERWARAAKAAVELTGASAQVRGTAMVVREQAAENLTRARDGLAIALSARAAERNLPRDYADGFFMQERKKKGPKTGQ